VVGNGGVGYVVGLGFGFSVDLGLGLTPPPLPSPEINREHAQLAAWKRSK
jgi:hypothetical protein